MVEERRRPQAGGGNGLDKSGPMHILHVLFACRGGPELEESAVKKKELEKFRSLLETQKVDLVEKARRTLEQDMAVDVAELPDDMDFATTQSDQGMTLRLRGREKTLLKKIEEALKRIDGGEFGICEECGDDIGIKRLEARPVTTLCIQCKSEQERREKLYV